MEAEEKEALQNGETPKYQMSAVNADLAARNWNKGTNVLDIADICYGKKSMWMLDYLKDMTALRNHYIRECMLIKKERERGGEEDAASIAEREAKKAKYVPEFEEKKEKYLAKMREEDIAREALLAKD